MGAAACNPPSHPRIVAIGGGTGLPVLLRGLKNYTDNLTAIVTMADDGGSSGRLRSEMGLLPPGDIRNCLVALADDESLMSSLFQYRFTEGSLAGHSFGNLFLAALTRVTGDFQEAVRASGDFLKSRGRVLPASLDMISLSAQLDNGREVSGQSLITNSQRSCRRLWLDPGTAEPAGEVIKALEEADLIVIGPGSLFTSIIPVLLIRKISQTVAAARCPRLFVCNVMTQPGETGGFTAANHVQALQAHAGEDVLDMVLVNTNEAPSEIVQSYMAEGASPVLIDEPALKSLGVNVIGAEIGFVSGDWFRHDGGRLAAAVMSVL